MRKINFTKIISTIYINYVLLEKIKNKKMKKITILLLFVSSLTFSQSQDNSYQELLKESPFNIMYPEFMAEDAAEYFKEFNKLFSE